MREVFRHQAQQHSHQPCFTPHNFSTNTCSRLPSRPLTDKPHAPAYRYPSSGGPCIVSSSPHAGITHPAPPSQGASPLDPATHCRTCRGCPQCTLHSCVLTGAAQWPNHSSRHHLNSTRIQTDRVFILNRHVQQEREHYETPAVVNLIHA
jgi:hypothetical protein